MPAKIKKLEIRIPETVENMMIGIAMQEFGGNLSDYTRDLIYKDLLSRRCIDQTTIDIIKDLSV